MQDFRISLNSSHGVFFANTQVTGAVYIKTIGPIKARQLTLSVTGRSRAAFHVRRGKHNIYYSSTVSYLNQETILWRSSQGSNRLPGGTYELLFSFGIPKNAPPNVETAYGSIRYQVKANIDVPWGFDKSRTVGFTVCPYIDLNVDRRLAIPVISGVHKTGLLSSKAVKLTITMPKMGYVCGESVPLRVEIVNESTSEVTSVESGIGATYTFIANSVGFSMANIASKRIFATYNVTDVPLPVGMNQNTFFNRSIDIPAIAPSFGHCANVKLQYHIFVSPYPIETPTCSTLQVKVHTRAIFSRSASASMPIVIGTVPLRREIAETSIPSEIEFEANIPPPSPGIPPPDYDFTEMNFHEAPMQKSSEHTEDKGKPPEYRAKFPYFSSFAEK